MNQSNVSQFLRSYKNRTALDVERPIPGGTINVRTLKLVQRSLLLSELCVIYFLPISPAYLLVYRCTTLLIVGDSAPVVEDVVECNSKLNPTKTTLLKVTEQLNDKK